MIVFAGIVPHSPILVPSIGKEHQEQFTKTLRAYEELEQALYVTRPETLVIISPHAHMYPDAFSGNVSPSYTGVLKEFGDHGTTVTAKSDFLMIDHIHRALRQENIPFTLTSEAELDYGYTIPLLLLTSHLQRWKLVPLAPSLLDGRMHYEFGRQLHSVLHGEQTRVALIASADLSHHVNTLSPSGETDEGKAFDAAVRTHAQHLDIPAMLAIPPNILEKADQCGYKPILTLLGCIETLNCTPKEVCYEAPFGVGALTMRFDIA